MKNDMGESPMKSFLVAAVALTFSITALAAELVQINGQIWCYVLQNGTAAIGAPSENMLAVPSAARP